MAEEERDGKGRFLSGNRYEIQKGEVKNPKGAPRGKRITTLIEEALEGELGGRNVAEILAEQILKQALSGNYQFVREVLERVEGKVADRITGDSDGGLTVIFKRADETD
jgi:hypothetical protein